MTKTGKRSDGCDDRALMALFGAIAARDEHKVTGLLDASPALASCPINVAASREDPKPYFLTAIHHYAYGGDTALHIAAAAYQPTLAQSLVELGADVRARNRRGAEPLHYAADGRPGADDWMPAAQREVIVYLIEAGANPNALDKSGVGALHRAVRTRSSAAVSALVEHGAEPLMMNQKGSTPLHLAVQNTGKSNSGSDAARDEQARIIAFLLAHGARASDVDAKGKTVAAAVTSSWIRELLDVSSG